MKLVLKNKKVAIIAGVSAAVLVTALGVGLGVGLNNSSSSDENPSYTADANHYATSSGVGVSGDQIESKKATIDGTDYSIKKIGEDFYLEIPSVSESIHPVIELHTLFGSINTFYNALNPSKGQGKDGFYNINNIMPSMSIGVVKIPNDGKIYGGFVNSTKENIDYEVNSKLTKVFPNGYEIGSFNSDGKGGINFLKLQELKTLLKYNGSLNSESDVNGALQNSPTTTRFGFFLQNINNKNIISLAFNKEASEPSEIGYVPTVFDQPIEWPGSNYQASVVRETTLEDLATRGQDFPIVFPKGFVTGTNSSDRYVIHLDQGVTDLSQEIKEVNLSDLKILFTYISRKFTHPLLGQIETSVNGPLLLDDSIILKNGESPNIKLNADSTFTTPSLLIKFKATTFDNTMYATTAMQRETDELLINVQEELLDYFKTAANNQQIKDFANEIGITIRFKVANIQSESTFIAVNGPGDSRSSEVIFLDEHILNNLGKNSLIDEEAIAPLLEDGILKTNLDNPTYFEDSYRTGAKIFTKTNTSKYGIYPFIRETQVIAYNSDYLPNGLDFSNNQTIASYLYNDNLGSLSEVRTTKSANTVENREKNGLLVNDQLATGGTVWAFDYYNEIKKDQQPNQQDIVWKKVTRGSRDTEDPAQNAYWSVFADSGLKDDSRFQKWVDHVYYSAGDRIGDLTTNTDELYDKYALFNGHIGAIMIDSSWVNEEWKSGTWRAEGTDEEKQAFAQQKIKFQGIPTGMVSGLYGAMVSILKKDMLKQKLAEMFLNALTTPNNALEFYASTSNFLARKDINVTNNDSDNIAANLYSAVIDTKTVFGVESARTSNQWWPLSVFQRISKNIKSDVREQFDNYYEKVANDYKEAVQNEQSANVLIFAPENPN